MRLLTLLILRLMAVVLLCLTVTIGCLTYDAHRSIEADVAGTAVRVGQHLKGLYWNQLVWRDGSRRGTLMPLPEWETLATQSIISPGVCVTFGPLGTAPRRLCSQMEALGPLPPVWFSAAYLSVLGPHEAQSHFLSIREKSAGVVVTQADPDAALRRAWREISTVVEVAVMMAAGIALLAALMIGHALLPARAIIEALRQLEEGQQLSLRLSQFKSTELNHIAIAVNRLGARLRQTNQERLALTARLFQVQEEERRAIARDLHDEFGQALAATSALAAVIEDNAGSDRPDIARDARAIGKTQREMMQTLRSTLVRLRSQSIEELGIEASLRQLVSDFNAQSKSATVFRLQMAGRLSELQKRVAVDVYRIVQECLTNASKHGRPSEVIVRLERGADDNPLLALTVEDDGGGDVRSVQTSSGHGILGIRERLAALGGALSIVNAPRGIRVLATVPAQHGEGYA